MAIIDNLVSYWKMDETAGNSRVDSHGSNDLSDITSTASGTGIISNGADFEASGSDYLEAGDDNSLDITGSISLQMWFKPESTPASVSFCKGDNGDSRAYHFDYTDDGTNKRIKISGNGSGGDFFRAYITYELTAGNWYHIVWAINPANLAASKIYVNGSGTTVTVQDSNANGNIRSTTGALVVGKNGTDGTAFTDGIVDEIGLWNRVLTDDDVTGLYNGGAGLAYPFSNAYTLAVDTMAITPTFQDVSFTKSLNLAVDTLSVPATFRDIELIFPQYYTLDVDTMQIIPAFYNIRGVLVSSAVSVINTAKSATTSFTNLTKSQ